MTYERKMYKSPEVGAPAGTEWTTIYYIYDQPLRNRVHYLIYKAWWTTAWKVKPIDWVVDHLADPVREWWHKRSCDGMCTTWTYAEDGSSWTGCELMPLSAAMDCKRYELDIKNNSNVKRL